MAIALELLSVLLVRATVVLALRRLLHIIGLKSIVLEIAWLIPAVLITFIVPWVFRSRAGWGWSEFGLDPQNWLRLVLIGLVGFSLTLPVDLLIFWFNVDRYAEVAKAQGFDLAQFARLPIWQLLIWGCIGLPILTFLGAALPEEFFYRGYIQGLLARSVGPASAFLVSMIQFSFGHYFAVPGGWFFALQTIPGSLLFGFLYLTTGSIIPGITAHLLRNLVGSYLQFAHFTLGAGAFLGLAGVILAVSSGGWFLTRHGISQHLAQGAEAIARIPQESWLAALGFLAVLIGFTLFRHIVGERWWVLAIVALGALALFLLFVRLEEP
ncbi:hypothetical protein HRbin07_00071 [bacterium HR07]|uniref:CAAX prenyl protease 2/Lysostaphin resistance protein A-like domain-containing protein n=2 Tax=Candidatus Bipolaricaulota TaxID=67810 RepID=H5SH97_9BACT|nr:hypothetical protein HGMM_F28H07C07 [uncultured Acetothermia bacterium]BAL58972.1 hypothetical protein HGMM_OP3C127 [Candidatus Acetothermum autotrophicum]GBC75879.1 hypothetical protein HRbin07_00071 [bacterium HR07]